MGSVDGRSCERKEGRKSNMNFILFHLFLAIFFFFPTINCQFIQFASDGSIIISPSALSGLNAAQIAQLALGASAVSIVTGLGAAAITQSKSGGGGEGDGGGTDLYISDP